MTEALSQAERAYDQVVEWLEHFEELEDPRQAGKVAYPLDEMLLQCLFAVLAGAGSWVEIALFGKGKLERNATRRATRRAGSAKNCISPLPMVTCRWHAC